MSATVIDAVLIVAAAVYLVASFLLFVLGANLIALSVIAWRRGRDCLTASAQPVEDDPERLLPTVTVQLPIYNELYVAERIIKAAAALEYPPDRLQIQVLDDSTDETRLLIAVLVAELASTGTNIVHIHREDRSGYKAGALAAGLQTATGELVAIFDADFVPRPDFLLQTIEYFDDPSIGFVQGRWGHLNRDFSAVTRLQSMAIDAHFLVEQMARKHKGFWFNFNGTAGVWRTAAIVDAGGWTADTLTEDLDLSYRAHLRGWRGQYLPDVEVPGELPYHIASFRRQQHRWARGSLECAAKLLPSTWRSKAPFLTRFEATAHLVAYSIHLLLALLALIYPLVVAAAARFDGYGTLFGLGYFFALSSLAPGLFFITGQHQLGRPWVRDLPWIVAVTMIGSGLMLNTVRAAWQIFTRPNPEFERTAKFGIDGPETQTGTGTDIDTGSEHQEPESAVRHTPQPENRWFRSRYVLGLDRIVYSEIALGFYCLLSALLAVRYSIWGIALYAAIFTIGLWSLAGISIAQALAVRRGRGPDPLLLDRPAIDLDGMQSDDQRSTMELEHGQEASMKRAVLIMAKQPVAGSVKTRLMPVLSSEDAAELSRCFITDAAATARTAAREQGDTNVIIAGAPAASEQYFRRLSPDLDFIGQAGETLGDRLDHVMTEALDRGAEQVLAINSDSPTLPPSLLADAFRQLSSESVDVVLGPAEDGGYYLIGWKRPHPRLVRAVEMSTPRVLDDTLAIAAQEGLRVAMTDPWYDIDDPQDLRKLRADLDQGSGCGPATRAFFDARPTLGQAGSPTR